MDSLIGDGDRLQSSGSWVSGWKRTVVGHKAPHNAPQAQQAAPADPMPQARAEQPQQSGAATSTAVQKATRSQGTFPESQGYQTSTYTPPLPSKCRVSPDCTSRRKGYYPAQRKGESWTFDCLRSSRPRFSRSPCRLRRAPLPAVACLGFHSQSLRRTTRYPSQQLPSIAVSIGTKRSRLICRSIARASRTPTSRVRLAELAGLRLPQVLRDCPHWAVQKPNALATRVWAARR